MNRIYPYLDRLQALFVALVGVLSAFFDSTSTFVYALVIAFSFNILAGFRADEVKFKMWRLVNFKGSKLKDSLAELLLIFFTTYILKLLIDLMKQDGNMVSAFVVQVLIGVAVYYYFRNALRNLSCAYPKSIWLRVVYHLISFQFKKLVPENVSKAMDKAEDEVNNQKRNK